MIPEIKHPLIATLIDRLPAVFNKTAMVGIYDGQDICSCFLNRATKLDHLYFYENFHDSETDQSKNSLLKKYEYWKSNISNLSIEIGDGTALLTTDHLDFLFTDAYNIDYKTYFLDNRFDNTLMAICGYGAAIERTVHISVCIDKREIYPVLLHNGFLFFTNNYTYYQKIHGLFKTVLEENNISYVNQLKCLRPNGWYHSLLNND